MDHSVLDLKPGSVIQDTYQIKSLLGEGGMGATFRGVNMATGHDVAIKVMVPSFARNKQASDLFRREANLLRTVQNDAVVRFETTMMDKTGRLFLVMEFVPGRPLAHFLEQGARLASVDVLKLGLRLAQGLEAIHKLGIVHRDVAPDNIMVSNDNITLSKFIDFGLASDAIGTDKSIIGSSFAGKLKYSSPEQLGLFDNKVTAATDVYALGLVLMRSAGLQLPGEGKGFAAVEDRRTDITINDTRVGPVLKQVLEAMLRADPKRRDSDLSGLFRKALSEQAVADQLQEQQTSADTDRIEKTGATDSDRPAKSGRGRQLSLVVGFLGVMVLGGGGVWYYSSSTGFSGKTPKKQVLIAHEAVAADDPLDEVETLIGAGGDDNLNAALGALMALSRDYAGATDQRVRASIMIAEMYDPNTHDTKRSPFPQPNPNAARRYYQRAADLGSADAKAALTRLAE